MTDNKEKNRGLGRGLSALLADVDLGNAQPKTTNATQDTLPIEFLHPNKDQPRQQFDPSELAELAQSIAERGIIQPIIVRKLAEDQYQIVAGERRWRAAQMAKLHSVPTIVRNYTAVEVQEIALIENIQRQDLNVMEEAQAYQALMQTHGHTQEKLAEALGKSRSHIANLLRLLNLPTEVQMLVREGQLSMGHARALLSSDEPLALAKRAVREGLSVRDVEKMAKTKASESQSKPKAVKSSQKDADTELLEQELSVATGFKIAIDHHANGGGKVYISYETLDELDGICKTLSLNK